MSGVDVGSLRVAATRALSPASEELLQQAGVDMITAPSTSAGDLVAVAREADVLIVRDPLPEYVFATATRVRAAIRHGTGLDMIPVEEASRQGVLVVSLPGVNAQAVAEHVVMVSLALLRRLRETEGDLRGKGWDAGRAHAEAAMLLRGRIVGVIGTGAVARALGHLVRAFGARILATGSVAGQVPEGFEWRPLHTLLEESDVLVVACALNEETRGLLDENRLARMRPTSVLINVARGPIVDVSALLRALRRGGIGAAALDVYDQEPLPGDDPLLQAPRLLLTPHTAGLSADTADELGRRSALAALAVLRGEIPAETVNLDRVRQPARYSLSRKRIP